MPCPCTNPIAVASSQKPTRTCQSCLKTSFSPFNFRPPQSEKNRSLVEYLEPRDACHDAGLMSTHSSAPTQPRSSSFVVTLPQDPACPVRVLAPPLLEAHQDPLL